MRYRRDTIGIISSHRRSLQGLLLLFFLLILPYRSVFGVFTPEQLPEQCDDGAWSNCTNVFEDDADNATYTSTRPVSGESFEVWGFPSFFLPGNATVTDIEVEITGMTNNSSAGRQLWIQLSKDGGATWQTNSAGNDLMWLNPPQSMTLHTYITNDEHENFTAYNWDYSDFNSGNVRVKVGAYDNTETTYAVDYVKMLVRYDIPNTFMYVMDSEASPSGQFVSLDLMGQTSTASATMQCIVTGYERCTSPYQPVYSNQNPVFHIMLDGSNTATQTADLGGGWYKAHGWGAQSYAWEAEGVHAPYNPGYYCDYPWDLLCTDNGEVAQVSLFSDFSGQVATPSGQTLPTLQEPEPTDPLSWVVWKIRQTLREFFVPNVQTVANNRILLDAEMRTRVPFAYAINVLSIDLGNSPGSSTAASIDIPLAANAGGIIPDIHWTPPSYFTSGIAILRDTGVGFLWISFIAYILIRTRIFFGA